MDKCGYKDPSENDNYAIRFASERGHLEVVKELLNDARVDPSVVDLDEIEHPEIKKLLKMP